jgi:hypothetical protein
VASQLQHFTGLIEEYDVDRELHPDGVHSFARNDPKAAARRQPLVMKQARPALPAGVRKLCRVRQFDVACQISNAHSIRYRTKRIRP